MFETYRPEVFDQEDPLYTNPFPALSTSKQLKLSGRLPEAGYAVLKQDI
jgi:hypothetical protein